METTNPWKLGVFVQVRPPVTNNLSIINENLSILTNKIIQFDGVKHVTLVVTLGNSAEQKVWCKFGLPSY